MSEKQQLYDKLCDTLTDYENFVQCKEGDDSEIFDYAADLYQMLVEIQNKWETVVTAE